MKRPHANLVVTACGALSSALTVFVMHGVERPTGFSFFAWELSSVAVAPK